MINNLLILKAAARALLNNDDDTARYKLIAFLYKLFPDSRNR
jgi:hypothetical protein